MLTMVSNECNGRLVYEFERVDGFDGTNKMLLEHGTKYCNPVFIKQLSVGRSANLIYSDKRTHGVITSKVVSIIIWENSINFITENTNYWLKPYIREEV